MPGLLPVLTPILLVDMLNPVLLAFLVFAAGSKRPVINSSAMLLGHTASYFIAGIALSYAVDAISKRMAAPQAIDYIIGAVLGLALVFFALKPSKPSSEPDLPEIELTPLKCFSYGAIINMIGLPFAVPYLGMVQISLNWLFTTFDLDPKTRARSPLHRRTPGLRYTVLRIQQRLSA